jgi:hypothetical protein
VLSFFVDKLAAQFLTHLNVCFYVLLVIYEDSELYAVHTFMDLILHMQLHKLLQISNFIYPITDLVFMSSCSCLLLAMCDLHFSTKPISGLDFCGSFVICLLCTGVYRRLVPQPVQLLPIWLNNRLPQCTFPSCGCMR